MNETFAARLRARETAIGYWVTLDSPAATERIARLGYDYVAIDAQHGLLGYSGMLAGLTAIDAAASARADGAAHTRGLVRVGANDPTMIGAALDAGAVGVIVPLIDTADDARRAVVSARYAPVGSRSYGPMRSGLRVGPIPADADAQTAVILMIETAAGLANVEQICATPGVDGVYIGPSDLSISIGGAFPRDPAVEDLFEAALRRISAAAASSGIAAGIHCTDGATARQRLSEGFTFASIASDLVHLEAVAAGHLAAAAS